RYKLVYDRFEVACRFFFASRRRHTRSKRDWSSDVCSSDLKWCHQAYGINYAALRYFNAAGANTEVGIGEDHHPESHLIPIVLQAALGKRDHVGIFGDDYPTPDGTCIRDYILVRDLVSAHLLALEHLARGGESGPFILGNGTGYSVKEIIET